MMMMLKYGRRGLQNHSLPSEPIITTSTHVFVSLLHNKSSQIGSQLSNFIVEFWRFCFWALRSSLTRPLLRPHWISYSILAQMILNMSSMEALSVSRTRFFCDRGLLFGCYCGAAEGDLVLLVVVKKLLLGQCDIAKPLYHCVKPLCRSSLLSALHKHSLQDCDKVQ